MGNIAWQLVRLVGPIVLLDILIGYYVYWDKKRRDENHAFVSALGYGVLGLVGTALGQGLLGLIGLFRYLYLRGSFTRLAKSEKTELEH